MAFTNSFTGDIYKEEWATKLQERLSENTKWKDICKVEYTNSRVIHNPYLTDPTVQTHERGTAYTMQAITVTDEYATLSTSKILPQFIDRADLAQCDFLTQMQMAEAQAVLIDETLESAVYGDYGNLTDFGSEDLAGSTGSSQITVSASNVDDIIRGIKRTIRAAGGEALMDRNGVFIVWRPADLEIVEAFAQANGFSVADTALRNGVRQGFEYMGVTHYSSNKLTANHVVAGVKKVYHLAILKDTYGQIMVNDKDPNETSGISVVTRVDYIGKAWAKVKPVLFDVNVA